MSYFAHLCAEHATFLSTVLERGEADIAREIMHASGRYPQTPRLGHRGAHTPKLALGDYLAAEATPPARVHRGLFRGYTDVLANDTLGDCGEAMVIHGIEGMHHAAGTAVPPFNAQDAISLYEPVGGYVPGEPSTDQGTDNQTLVDYWTKTGVRCAADGSVHTILATVWVDPAQEVQSKIAIYEMGVLFRSVNLPLSAQGQTRWSVVGDGRTGSSAPGSWGGHDIPYMAYDEADYDADSWGMWLPVDQAFDTAYAIQGFAVIAPDMRRRSGVSPTGLDWSALLADLQKL